MLSRLLCPSTCKPYLRYASIYLELVLSMTRGVTILKRLLDNSLKILDLASIRSRNTQKYSKAPTAYFTHSEKIIALT